MDILVHQVYSNHDAQPRELVSSPTHIEKTSRTCKGCARPSEPNDHKLDAQTAILNDGAEMVKLLKFYEWYFSI